jgi:iron complex outermembrane receptor protein
MKFYLAICILSVLITGLSVPLKAQIKAGTRVTGKVLDEAGKPLDYATVSLLKVKDSISVQVALSSESGSFVFSGIATGSFIITVSSVGYARTVSAPFTILSAAEPVSLPTIIVKSSSRTLSQVTISAARPLVERRSDRLVVNVAGSVLAAGNNSLDILSRLPGVTLDKDDNVSLNGKQGVTVMIDDKLTYLSSSQLAALLRSTDGSTVQAVEIIANPSAKYDASGNAGIINIKLKKNTQNGTNGTLTLGAGIGRFFRDQTGLSMSHKSGSLNVFANINRSDNNLYFDATQLKTVSNGPSSTYFNDHNYEPVNFHYNNFRAGADFNSSAKNTVGVIVKGYSNPGTDKGNDLLQIGSQEGNYSSYQTTSSKQLQSAKNIGINLNDHLILDSLGQQLSVDLDYSKFSNGNDAQYNTDYFLTNGTTAGSSSYLRQQTPSVISIHTAKADYSYPLGKTLKLETGIKLSKVKSDNDLKAQTSSNNVTYVNDAQLSNHFIYIENVDAAYINANKEFGKTTLQAGLRLEYTGSTGSLNDGIPARRHYLNLFPSLFYNRTINEKNQIGLSYSRRIDRPNYQDLNPFIYYQDQYNFQEGNPLLRPQYTNSFELHYTYNKTINVSLNYARTRDVITQVLLTDTASKATTQTYLNISSEDYYSLNIDYPFTVNSWWSGSIDGNLFHSQFKSDSLLGAGYNRGKLAFTVKSTQIFRVTKNNRIEIFGTYTSPELYGVYNLRPRYSADMGINHSFSSRTNLKLSVTDVFFTDHANLTANYRSDQFYLGQFRDSRVIRLTFTHNFGSSVKNNSDRKSGSQEEINRIKNATQ